jgi:hypothetical protein
MQTYGATENESVLVSDENTRFQGVAIYSDVLIRVLRIVDTHTGMSAKYEVPLELAPIVKSNFATAQIKNLSDGARAAIYCLLSSF